MMATKRLFGVKCNLLMALFLQREQAAAVRSYRAGVQDRFAQREDKIRQRVLTRI